MALNVPLLVAAIVAATPSSGMTARTSSGAESFSDEVFDDSETANPATQGATQEEGSYPLERRPQLIEAIEILGNSKTGRDVILRRLSVSVGEALDETKIDQSRLRLLSTGFFKSAEFSLRRGSRRGRVVVVIEIEERNTIVVNGVYLGTSKVAPFFGGLGVLENNFFGRGVSAGAGFVVGKDRRGLNVQLFVPDLSNTSLQLSASAVLVQGAEVLDPNNPTGTQLTYSRFGGTLGVGLGVGGSQRVSLDYRLESIHADRLPSLDPVILRAAPSIQFDESVLSSLTLSYERDTRDDSFVPTQGQRLALAVETGTSLLGSSYEFTKYTAEGQLAFSVGQSALSLRAFGGLVQGQTPFFNQFFLNDYTAIVFGRSSLPRALGLNFSESNDYDDLALSLGADYNIPLVEGGDWLYRAFLYFGAQVAISASLGELQEDPGGRGIGHSFPGSIDAGLKLDTFIGPLTLSLAYLFNLGF